MGQRVSGDCELPHQLEWCVFPKGTEGPAPPLNFLVLSPPSLPTHLPLLIPVGFLGHFGVQDPHCLLPLLQTLPHAFLGDCNTF